jgi:hypothetical protein
LDSSAWLYLSHLKRLKKLDDKKEYLHFSFATVKYLENSPANDVGVEELGVRAKIFGKMKFGLEKPNLFSEYDSNSTNSFKSFAIEKGALLQIRKNSNSEMNKRPLRISPKPESSEILFGNAMLDMVSSLTELDLSDEKIPFKLYNDELRYREITKLKGIQNSMAFDLEKLQSRYYETTCNLSFEKFPIWKKQVYLYKEYRERFRYDHEYTQMVYHEPGENERRLYATIQVYKLVLNKKYLLQFPFQCKRIAELYRAKKSLDSSPLFSFFFEKGFEGRPDCSVIIKNFKEFKGSYFTFSKKYNSIPPRLQGYALYTLRKLLYTFFKFCKYINFVILLFPSKPILPLQFLKIYKNISILSVRNLEGFGDSLVDYFKKS